MKITLTDLRFLSLFLGPLPLVLFFLTGTSLQGVTGILPILFWMFLWWVTEAVPIAVTALLPLFLFPMVGIMKVEAVSASYGNSVIYLFFGGFVLATAMEKHNLHKRIAFWIVERFGKTNVGLLGGFIAATAFLSMWVSNTATTVMMLPIALSVAGFLRQAFPQEEKPPLPPQALLLAIAYASSIGGTATIIGTPPNVVLVGFLQSRFGIEISFAQWLIVGVPFAVLMLILLWFILKNIYCPHTVIFQGEDNPLQTQEDALPDKLSPQEKAIAIIFSFTALAWIFRLQIIDLLNITFLTDTVIAMGGALLTLIVPIPSNTHKKAQPLLDWQDTAAIPWGILLLFGGGLALASAMEQQGLMQAIGDIIKSANLSPLFIIIVLAGTAIFLTEVMSNVALVTVFLPVVAGIAQGSGLSVIDGGIITALGASCAFMLPMATPPNAIVFAGGHLTVGEMSRVGLLLNIVAWILLSLMPYSLLLFLH